MRRIFSCKHMWAIEQPSGAPWLVFFRKDNLFIGNLFNEHMPKFLPIALYQEWDLLAETVLAEVLMERRRKRRERK